MLWYECLLRGSRGLASGWSAERRLARLGAQPPSTARLRTREVSHERANPLRPSTRRPADSVVQPHAGHRAGWDATASAAEPDDEGAHRARRPHAAVSDVGDRTRGLDRSVDRHSRAGPRHLQVVEALAAS